MTDSALTPTHQAIGADAPGMEVHRPAPWWQREWPLAVLLLVVLLISAATFGNVAAYIRGDWPTMFVPPYAFLGERLRALSVPGWNPYQFSGLPFAADPSSGWMYLPAMVIYAVLPPFAATTVFIAFHLLLSAAAAYTLARLTGRGPAATTSPATR